MRKRAIVYQTFFLSGLMLAGSGIGFAQDSPLIQRGDVMTARNILSTTRGYGVANAMSASASGTSAIWHNPAGIAEAIMYTVDASYLYDHETSGHGFQANVVDSKSNEYVSAGIGLLYEYGKPDKSQHLVNARFGIAVPLADRLICLGITGLYSYLKYDGNKIVSQFSMDAGVIVRPLEWMTIGFSAQNIIVGDHAAYMPRILSFGIAAGSLEYGFNFMFDASFNPNADDIAKSADYSFGAEYLLKKLVPIRAGYRYEADNHHVLAVGLGYRDAGGMFGLDLAYQHHFKSHTSELFSASVDFYF